MKGLIFLETTINSVSIVYKTDSIECLPNNAIRHIKQRFFDFRFALPPPCSIFAENYNSITQC